jgi:hypothetical protein
MGTAGGRPWSRREQRAALVVLAIALVAAAVVLASYAAGLTYFQDSWEFLMHRRHPSATALLEPHNEHIVLLPVAIQELVLWIFGMGSTTPDFVVLIAALLVTAVLVFVYVRRRLGPWAGVIAAVLLLFLGPAWQDLLWPFQVGFVGSAAAGVGMLLALEEEGRGWDVAAGALLAVSIAFSSLGLPFAAAAIVAVAQRAGERGWKRLAIPVAPLALYAIWWAAWGHNAENHVSAHNIAAAPGFAGEGFGHSFDALLALATIFDEAVGRSSWGIPLLVALGCLVAVAVFRGRRYGLRSSLWPALSAALAFWLLAGANTIAGREAWSSRYLYIGALFVLLVAADLLRGVRIPRPALALAAVLALVVVGFNLVPLREGRDFFRGESDLTRADLGALEIAAPTVEPSFALPPEISGTTFLNEITAGEYLQAVSEYGSPADDPAALAVAPAADRTQADVVLANALPVAIETEAPSTPAAGKCSRVAGGAGKSVPLAPGRTTIALGPGGTGTVGLRRFAATDSLVTEGIAAGSTTVLDIPADRSDRPWLLRVTAPGGASVCTEPA